MPKFNNFFRKILNQRPLNTDNRLTLINISSFIITGMMLLFVLYDISLGVPRISGILETLLRGWPILLGLIFVLVLRFKYANNYPRWMMQILLGLLCLIQLSYLSWRLNHTLILEGSGIIFSGGLLALEVLGVLNSWIHHYLILNIPNRSKIADELAKSVRKNKNKPDIDIFIPTYGETADLLKRTLIGCLSLKYPKQNKHIWVLDDGHRDEIKDLARQCGCHYLTRPNHDAAKAGNLNHALNQTHGKYVIVFDADFVPLNHFIERTIGFLESDPTVALVITPQKFYNPDPPSKNLGGNIISDEQTIFYQILQPSRDAANASVCSGSSVIYRRDSLESIGGVPTDSIVEDYLTGLLLHAQGYRSIYLNEFLSVGCAANTLEQYIQQRIRWAEGTLKTIFSRYNPCHLKGLTWLQRIIYTSGILYWLEESLKIFSYCSPLLFLFFGVKSINFNLTDASLYGLSTYAFSIIMLSWLRGSFLLIQIYGLLHGFHILLRFPVIFFRSKRVSTFKVTNKALASQGINLNLRMMRHIIILLAISLGAIAYSFRNPERFDQDIYVFYLLWAQFNILMLGAAFIAGVDTDRDRGFPRVPCVEIGALHMPNGTDTYIQIIELSEWGFSFSSKDLPNLSRLDTVELHIIDSGIRGHAVVEKIRQSKKQYYCRFINLSDKDIWKIVNLAYCNPNNWYLPNIPNDWDAIRAIASGLFYLYPFREPHVIQRH